MTFKEIEMNLLTTDELWKFWWNKPEVPEGGMTAWRRNSLPPPAPSKPL